MSKFLDWLAGLGQRSAEPQPDVDAIARRVLDQLRSAPEPSDPKPLTDSVIRRGLTLRGDPSGTQLQQLRTRIAALTKRQQQVLHLSAEDGLTYKQIARRLGITDTVALRELTAAYHALSLRGPPR